MKTKTYPRLERACERVKEELHAVGIPVREDNGLPNCKIIWDPTQPWVAAMVTYKPGERPDSHLPDTLVLNLWKILRQVYSGLIVQIIYHELVHWYDARLEDVRWAEAQRDQHPDNIHDSVYEVDALAIQRKLFFEFLGKPDPGIK